MVFLKLINALKINFFSFNNKKINLFTLFIAGVEGVGTFRLNIYLINIPRHCSSFTKYFQRRLAGNADADFL